MEEAKAKDERIAKLITFFEGYPSLLKKQESKGIFHLIGSGQTNDFGWVMFTGEVNTFLTKLDYELAIPNEIAKDTAYSVGSLERLVKAMTPRAEVSRLLARLEQENENKIARDPKCAKAKKELSRLIKEGKAEEFEGWMLRDYINEPKLNISKLHIQFRLLIWDRYRSIWKNYHRCSYARNEKQNRVLLKNMRHILKVLSGPGFRPPPLLGLWKELEIIKGDLERYLVNFDDEKKRYALERGKQYHGWLMFPLCNMLQYCYPRVGRSETLDIFRQIFSLLFPNDFYLVDQSTAQAKFVAKVERFLQYGQDKILLKELDDIDRDWTETLGRLHPFTEYKEDNREQYLKNIRIAMSIRQERPKGKRIPLGRAIASQRKRKSKYEYE